MAEFHDRLAAVQREVWETGTAPSVALADKLADLAGADVPEGVTRLPTSRMRAGPHLGAQADASEVEAAASARAPLGLHSCILFAAR